jgi:hypothetical protein
VQCGMSCSLEFSSTKRTSRDRIIWTTGPGNAMCCTRADWQQVLTLNSLVHHKPPPPPFLTLRTQRSKWPHVKLHGTRLDKVACSHTASVKFGQSLLANWEINSLYVSVLLRAPDRRPKASALNALRTGSHRLNDECCGPV